MGKVEKASFSLKKILAKLCQETSESGLKLLLIALLRMRITPKSALKLSPDRMLYGRLFLTSAILFDSEVQDQKVQFSQGQILRLMSSLLPQKI